MEGREIAKGGPAGEEPGIGGFTVSLENVPATQRKAMPAGSSGDEAVPLRNQLHCPAGMYGRCVVLAHGPRDGELQRVG